MSETEQRAWKEACERTTYSCVVAPPVIKKSEYAKLLNSYGFYNGGAVIWLAEDLDIEEDLGYAVLVHEMVHYLQNKSGDFPYDSKLTQCLQEEEAWVIYNEVVLDLGREDLHRDKWFKSYPGC